MGIEQFDQLGEVSQRAGQPVHLIDDDDVDPAGRDIRQQPLQGRAIGGSAREAAIIISRLDERPACMRLTSDIGLGCIILGIQRVELLIKAGVRRHPGIDRAPDNTVVVRLHVRTPLPFPARRPKKRGPFQFVPVIANAIPDRLSKVLPSKAKPPSTAITR
ncbi:hypothetical protein ACMYR2_0925 [Nitrobacter sp. TKz-YC01]